VPSFRELYGHDPAVRAGAPGRVNLIGEHTDYNDGLMLPTLLPQRTTVELSRRPGGEVHAWSAAITRGGGSPMRFTLGAEARTGRWIDYVQGATRALAGAGCDLAGFSVRIDSTLPRGGGVSSSAALLVAVLRGLRRLFDFALDDVALAHLARQAEHELVGAPVGIMDPMVCGLGRDGYALLIDAAASATRLVPLPPALGLIVIDSGIHHRHAGGDYRTRTEECGAAARALGIATLRAVETLDAAEARIAALPAPLGRRVRHVVSENARVRRAVAALEAGDLPALGAILDEGHASLRDDYAVSLPPIDRLVAIARAQPGVHGARLTGGGFGGSIVALAARDMAPAAAAATAAAYAAETGRQPAVLVPAAPASGAASS
jgi:galactokinase